MYKHRLAIIHTHPIQYNSTWFIKLNQIFDVKVFYTWKQTHKGYWDKKFKRYIKWDIPLTQNYEFEFVSNISPKPSPNTMWGIINPRLISKIRNFNPDFILIYGWKNLSHLIAMIYFYKKITILFRGDSTLLDNKNSIKSQLRHTILKWVYKHIDYALYVGRENKKYFIANGLSSNQLIFVPHAVNNEFFLSAEEEYENQAKQWRANLGLTKNNLTFLYAGKFEPKKNIDTLIKAFLKDPNQNHRLILVGNGQEEKRLKSMASTDKRIIFLPFQNQSVMPIVYRLGHIFILPTSYNETWGLSVNEAMACGKAIIVSNKVGCSTDLVKPNINGFVFTYDDYTMLSELLQKMSIEKAKNMGQKSKEIIKFWSYETGIKNITNYLLNNNNLKRHTK